MTEIPFPIRDEITGEVISDPDGEPIGELAAADYLGLVDAMSIEELAAGERTWRFGHVIVDEAQDLTAMQWRMVARRARGHSMTIVGDIAQRSIGEVQRWSDLLPAELGDVARFDLTTNYRSSSEVAELAAKVLAEIAPGLEPPVAIRTTGHQPLRICCNDLQRELVDLVDSELGQTDGRIAVIGQDVPAGIDGDRIVIFTPRESKGMEFDSVIVVEPADIVAADGGLSLLYVALTRSTDRLTIAHQKPLPPMLLQ